MPVVRPSLPSPNELLRLRGSWLRLQLSGGPTTPLFPVALRWFAGVLPAGSSTVLQTHATTQPAVRAAHWFSSIRPAGSAAQRRVIVTAGADLQSECWPRSCSRRYRYFPSADRERSVAC